MTFLRRPEDVLKTSVSAETEPLGGGSLAFTIKFLEIPGTHFIDL